MDNLGNKSSAKGMLPGFTLPPRGTKSVGLQFGFSSSGVKKQGGRLGNEFNLIVEHRSNPPGHISIMNLKQK